MHKILCLTNAKFMSDDKQKRGFSRIFDTDFSNFSVSDFLGVFFSN